jgi:hypothetical protein
MRKILLALLLCAASAQSQQRIHTHNNIGWYNYFGTFKLSEKWGIHTEYQWRRNEVITQWQQGLLRAGINYNPKQNLQLRLGYAWIETYPYGDIPLNGLGRDFTEHRIFQMLQLGQREGIVDLSHRFILEQRFVGRYNSAESTTEDKFPLQNRARYMVRAQIPLKGKQIADKTPYAALYDEIFIGFGNNVGANVFDQNRIGALLGYKINNTLRVEGGYLYQLVQYGRLIDGKNVFQHNHGIVLSLNLNVNLAKTEG